MKKDNPIERTIGIAFGMFIATAILAVGVAILVLVQKAAIGVALALGGIALASLTACGAFFVADLAMKAADMPSGKWIIAVILISVTVAAVTTAVATWRVYVARDIPSAGIAYMLAAAVTFVATTIIAIVAKRSS